MPKRKVLLAGKSADAHHRGSEAPCGMPPGPGAAPLIEALSDSPFDLVHLPADQAAGSFPFTAAELAPYEVIILSDIASDSFLRPPLPGMWGKPMPNRLRVMRDWTRAGGALMMIGGSLSFQGIGGRARWRGTPVEEALPVTCRPYDDRLDVPEGFVPDIIGEPDNPILRGLGRDWPPLLGANEVTVRSRADVEVLAQLPSAEGGHPLLVSGHFGRGRTMVWTSDLGPHWVSDPFAQWPGFRRLWINALTWLMGGG